MRTTEPPIAPAGRLRATCQPADAVGHAVRVSADKAGGLYRVTAVDIDATAPHEARAFGVIATKQDATTCVVQTSGILAGVWSGLTPGRQLWVQTDATLADTPPSRPLTGRRTIQVLAYAAASDEAVIAPGPRVRVLPE